MPKQRPRPLSVQELYDLLFARFGPQNWWPGDSPFEIAVGAILTQNTNWTNVEKAVANLKRKRVLSAARLSALPLHRLAELIRPSGYFNIKAQRLKAFLDHLMGAYGGSMARMKRKDGAVLRRELLSINGIGQETADSILLYALDKPVFVIDAYTKRVLSRHALIIERASYEACQALFHQEMDRDLQLFNEYHALFVRVGKEYCKPTPRCEGCPLERVPRQFRHKS
jgi:endonuclease-3 related protein